MSGRKKPSGPESCARAKIDAGSDRPESPRGDPTRIGGAAAQDGTVFDPASGEGFPGGSPSGTVFEHALSTDYVGKSGQARIRQDALFGAYDRISYEAANPILAAAAPLLMLLGELRLIEQREQPTLRRHLAAAIRMFERKCADNDIPDDDARLAKYALCEMADDVVGNLPEADRNAWLEDGMLARFFSTGTAGAGFYEALNTVLADPEEHCDLLELMHACLTLGYQGQYRSRPNGKEALERIRRDVYETLRYFRPRPARDLSPQWQGLGATVSQPRRLPLWVIVIAVPALITGIFFAARTVIADRADALAHELGELDPHDPPAIRHAAFTTGERPFSAVTTPAAAEPASITAPAPTALPARANAQLDRIRKQLETEIAKGTLSVGTKGEFVVVEIGDEVLFDADATRTKPAFREIARSLVAVLDKETGPVTIVGYTDSRKPGASSIFKSNYDLSLARAKAVKDILIRSVADPSRLKIEGKGDQDPVADNGSPEGRARNRRIDILIRRETAP